MTKSGRFARAGLRAELETLAACMRATPDVVWVAVFGKSPDGVFMEGYVN